MGYYTQFIIEIKSLDNQEIDADDIANELERIAGYTFDSDGTDIVSGDSIKWYEYERDMKKLAKMYPELLFSVSGIGEENGDIWKQYFKANQTSEKLKAKIVIPDPPDWCK